MADVCPVAASTWIFSVRGCNPDHLASFRSPVSFALLIVLLRGKLDYWLSKREADSIRGSNRFSRVTVQFGFCDFFEFSSPFFIYTSSISLLCFVANYMNIKYID